MPKSIIYQIIIFILILLIMAVTYYSFFSKKKFDKESKMDEKNLNNQIVEGQSGSRIEKIFYISEDENGNSYKITSDYGEFDFKSNLKIDEFNQKGSDIIKLENVVAVIDLKKSGIINISSKNALYNRVNLNTYFYEDVNLNFNEHHVKSYDLNMNYVGKNIKITGNVNYLNNNNFFNADIIEMDMLTKSSRIYMKKKTDKIKALVFN